MLKQNAKDPLWVVRMCVVTSSELGMIVGADGLPMQINVNPVYGPEHETTVHAPDENHAREFMRQQNPGAKIVLVERVTP